MTIIRTSRKGLTPNNRPPWSKVTAAGIFRVPCEGGTFDRHFHDCDEYWLVFAGKAKVMTEGAEYYVQRGDIVCTQTGDEHDVVEVYEDLEAFYFEDAVPPGGRVGHLHHTPDLASGHSVAVRPLPQDFPNEQ